MILSDQRFGVKSAGIRPLLIRSGLWVLLASAILLATWQLLRSDFGYLKPGHWIICDAEHVKGDFFVKKDYKFSGGKLRSERYAKSGSYSCEIPKGTGAQFGFGFDIQAPPVGTAFTARVWRLKNPLQEGKLVAKGEGKTPFYYETDQVVQQKDGWEQLELRFYAPYGADIQKISIYVYTNGYQDTYFDDLEILPSDHWQQGAFIAPKLRLDIKPAAWKILEKARDEALKTGILEAENGSWVEADLIDSTGQKIPVNLRLKGDWLDHLQGDKWSFRIEVKPPNAWNRMVTFSVHTPSTRYYLHEWLLHQLLEREDILTTRYDLVELEINGSSRGIYAYEEHFEKEVVEYRKRREGPIVKFSEEGFWAGIKRQLGEHGYVRNDAGLSAMEAYNADIAAFKEKRIQGTPELKKAFEQAQTLMTQYRYGLKAPSEVFDIERLAKYLALCDVTGGHHGVIWHNQRFYFNPVTGKLEPIGFDGFGEAPKSFPTLLGEGAMNPGSLLENGLLAHLFADSAFTALYTGFLKQFSSPQYLQPALDQLYAAWAPRLDWIQQEFPEYQATTAGFSNYALSVRSLLLPFNEQSVKVYMQSSLDGRQELQVSNTHTLPVVIIGYGSGKIMSGQLPQPVTLPGQTPRRLLSRLRMDSMIRDYGAIRYVDAEALGLQMPQHGATITVPASASTLYFKPLGLDTIFKSSIKPWHTISLQNTSIQKLFSNTKLPQNPSLEIKGSTIIIRAKKHKVEQPLVIPSGYQVFFEPGAELDLIKGAFFLSRSPVQMMGNAEAPIRIGSSDGSAKGFTVLQARETSVLHYVYFTAINTMNDPGWTLTGAVTFYESAVTLDHCTFYNIPSEDALNTIRTSFELSYCHFSKTASDAFDSDFCKGQISHSTFENTVNDGVDFSGSVATIKDCYMHHNGDKGISAGEESDISVMDTRISHNPLAVASKDLSVLWVRNLNITDCGQGFAAYQKKPEFGPSRIIVENYQAKNVRRLHAIAKGCILQLGDQLITK